VTDERYWKGIQCFNERDFFEAHEILEDFWREYRESDRTYLQALIQVSAGLYHADAGNFKGARSQLAKGVQKLNQYQPSHQGVDVRVLIRDLFVCLITLDSCERGELKFVAESFFPKITLTSEHP
jgi:hypothetical protein